MSGPGNDADLSPTAEPTMTVDAILAAAAELAPDERAELIARLRERYGDPKPPAGRPEQTGVYSLDQIAERVRRSS